MINSYSAVRPLVGRIQQVFRYIATIPQQLLTNNYLLQWFRVINGTESLAEATGVLIVSSAMFSNAGDYLCRATNDVGTGSQMITVEVIGILNNILISGM